MAYLQLGETRVPIKELISFADQQRGFQGYQSIPKDLCLKFPGCGHGGFHMHNVGAPLLLLGTKDDVVVSMELRYPESGSKPMGNQPEDVYEVHPDYREFFKLGVPLPILQGNIPEKEDVGEKKKKRKAKVLKKRKAQTYNPIVLESAEAGLYWKIPQGSRSPYTVTNPEWATFYWNRQDASEAISGLNLLGLTARSKRITVEKRKSSVSDTDKWIRTAQGEESEYDNPNADEAFKDRLGRCFELAGRFVSHNADGYQLCHGSIMGMGKPRIKHAWVLFPDGRVWEPILNGVFEPEVFQAFFNPLETSTYSVEETLINTCKYSHWGPWDSEEIRKAAATWISGIYFPDGKILTGPKHSMSNLREVHHGDILWNNRDLLDSYFEEVPQDQNEFTTKFFPVGGGASSNRLTDKGIFLFSVYQKEIYWLTEGNPLKHKEATFVPQNIRDLVWKRFFPFGESHQSAERIALSNRRTALNVFNVEDVRELGNPGNSDLFYGLFGEHRELGKDNIQALGEWVTNTVGNYIINTPEELIHLDNRERFPGFFGESIPDWAQKAFDRGELYFFDPESGTIFEKLIHILDWLVAELQENPEGTKRMLKRLSVPDAIRKSEEWTGELNKKSSDEEGQTETVYEFKDGWKIVKLLDEQAYNREGLLMNHCVASYITREESTIYSLRDPQNIPHATVETGPDDHMKQCQGNSNSNLKPEYQEMLSEWWETHSTEPDYTIYS